MKKLTHKFTKGLGLLLLLLAVVSSCKKSHTEDPEPVTTTTSSLSGKVDGKDIAISQSALTTTYYTTTGEASSLLTSAALDASGTKMDFFIPDLTAGTYNITPKLGTSSNPGNPGLKVQATTSTTTQTYISYTSTGNVYYAVSGTVIVTLDNDKVTVKWDISFKDATGRSFTSAGSFTIYFYKTVTKPKTEVKDPTPVTVKPTIDNISPTAGAAGDEVAIAGTNFSTTIADDVVKFNGVAATVKTATATKLTVTVPQGTTGAVTVKIANSDVTTGPTFTYLLPPTITALSATTGTAGDVITLTGTNFSTTAADNVVKFNGTAATVTAATATSLTVTVPQGVTTGAVTLSVKGGAAITGPTFTVKAATSGTKADYVEVLGGSASFSVIGSASSEITFMYVSRKNNMLFYNNGTQLYAQSLANGGAGAAFTTDTRIANVDHMVEDASGNLYIKSGGNVYKSTPDGRTITAIGTNMDIAGGKGPYLYLDAQSNVWLDINRKVVNGTLTAVDNRSINYSGAGITFDGNSTYISNSENYTSGYLTYYKVNLNTGNYSKLPFTQLSLFTDDDPTYTKNNDFNGSRFAFDDSENMYVISSLSYASHNSPYVVNFVIRKIKAGASTSTLISKFQTKFSLQNPITEPQTNYGLLFVADGAGNLYMKYNLKDIVKITY